MAEQSERIKCARAVDLRPKSNHTWSGMSFPIYWSCLSQTFEKFNIPMDTASDSGCGLFPEEPPHRLVLVNSGEGYPAILLWDCRTSFPRLNASITYVFFNSVNRYGRIKEKNVLPLVYSIITYDLLDLGAVLDNCTYAQVAEWASQPRFIVECAPYGAADCYGYVRFVLVEENPASFASYRRFLGHIKPDRNGWVAWATSSSTVTPPFDWANSKVTGNRKTTRLQPKDHVPKIFRSKHEAVQYLYASARL